MVQITRNQSLQRYDLLPENLKDVLFSSSNAEIIRRVGESQHLTEDKMVTIGKIIGYAILGFVHPEDLAEEIRNELGLNSAIAESIASEVDRKIFTPIRTDLEKVYSPATEEAEKTEEVLDLRGRIGEIEPTTKTAKEFKIQGAEMPELIITEEKPKTIPAVEPLKTEQPKIISTEQPKIIPIEEKKPITQLPPLPQLSTEGPLIIHKEAELKPFGESKKSLGGFFGFLRKGKPEEIKPSAVKAEVQMGLSGKRTEPPKIEPIVKSSLEPIKPRVVHYSEFKTPISPFPQDVNKDANADKRGLYKETPELIITEEKPKTIPTIEPLKVEQPAVSRVEPPKIIPIGEKKPEQINADNNVRESISNLRQFIPKQTQPPENLPMVGSLPTLKTNRIEPPTPTKIEPVVPIKVEPFMVRKEPPAMNQIKPPVINPVKPFMPSGVKPVVMVEIKPAGVTEIKPPVANKVESPMMNKIEPRVISKIEPIAASRVEPLIKKIPEIKIEEKPSSPSRLGFFDFLKMKFKKSSKPLDKKPPINEPPIKVSPMNKIESNAAGKIEPSVTSRIEPPKPDSLKPGEEVIDLNLFK